MSGIPTWVAGIFGLAVGCWGAYRLYLGLRKDKAENALGKVSPIMHIVLGAAFFLMGTTLVLNSFGIDPWNLRGILGGK